MVLGDRRLFADRVSEIEYVNQFFQEPYEDGEHGEVSKGIRQQRLPIPRTRGMSRAVENERIAFWSGYEWRSAGTVGRSYSISDDIRWR